ncbi:MAG: type II toxin-antitoxin system VapC family toxin [Defluviitaleaceae bacterium]|nr:type II toxin-antitoxin system VapC family toxin [Defluviitaleaceae bacterium]
MINFIADTHALLWMMFEPKKLSQKSREILADKNLHKFISITSLWEIAIKNRIGKLPLPMGIKGIISNLDRLGIGRIGVDQRHIEMFNSLPLLHRDPFDGIIIATALSESMTIITGDENIQKHDVSWIW